MIPPHATGPDKDCGVVSDVLGRIGNKWSILVMVKLTDSPVRFNHLRKQVGTITQKILTATLRDLERDGYISRTEIPGRIRHVEYELTELGRSVLRPMKALADWALANHPDVEAARVRFDLLR